MSYEDEIRQANLKLSRRDLLKATAALGASAMLSTPCVKSGNP